MIGVLYTVFNPETNQVSQQERDDIVNRNLEDIFKKLGVDPKYTAPDEDDKVNTLIDVIKANPLSGIFDIDEEETTPQIESMFFYSQNNKETYYLYIEYEVKLRTIFYDLCCGGT